MHDDKFDYLHLVETKYEFLQRLLQQNNLTAADLPLRFRTIVEEYSRRRCFAPSVDFNNALKRNWWAIPVSKSDRKELEWLVLYDTTETKIKERYNTLFGYRYNLTKDI